MAASAATGWFVEAVLATASCIAILANFLVILIFIRRPGLRTVSNRFVINLLLTNLLSSIVLIPLLLADEILKRTDCSANQGDSEYDGLLPFFACDDQRFNDTSPITFNNEMESLIITDDVISYQNVSMEAENRTQGGQQMQATILNDHNTSVELVLDARDASHKVLPVNNSVHLETLTDRGVTKCTMLCYLAEGTTSLICTASILSILLIAIDQYLAVVHPLRYHMRIDHFKSMILIAASWITAIVFGTFGAITPDKSDSLWNFCKRDGFIYAVSQIQSASNSVRTFYSITYFMCVILVPFLTICVIYVCIYSAAHKNSERMRHTNSGSITINVEPYVSVPATEDETQSDITEDGLMLKIDEGQNPSYKQSLETLNEIPSNISQWDSFDETEIKRVKSAPSFSIVDESEKTVEFAIETVRKSPSVENVPKNSPCLKTPNIIDVFWKLPKLAESFRKKSICEPNPNTPIGTPKQRAGSLVSTHSFMNTLKCRLSNASMFRYREETRAAKISTIVIIMVLACYIPYGVSLILHTTIIQPKRLALFDSVSLINLVLSSVISPFLFAYRNRRIKRELRKIFRSNKLNTNLNSNRASRTSSSRTYISKNLDRSYSKNHLNVNLNTLRPFLEIPPLDEGSKEERPFTDIEECKSILKSVCGKTKMWNTKKKTCNFMTVPDSCLNTECRSSFSSQNSTQISTASSDDP